MKPGSALVLLISMLLFLPAEKLIGDTVVLRNGRVLMISGYTLDGGDLTLELEGGGEVVCPVYAILKIERKSEYAHQKKPAGLAEKFDPHVAGICRIIEDAAAQFDVDACLIAAIVSVESNFDARAVSPRGAKGLMQLMPGTAKMYQAEDIFNPAENIRCGVKHLKMLMAVYDDQIELVLAAYNAGQSTVKKYHGIPPYQETRNYITRVTSLYEDLSLD